MESQIEKSSLSTRLVRWTARVWSICSIGLLIGFVVGEGINPKTSGEAVGLLFFPLGISLGMVLAWWKEGLGGSVTIGCLAVFYAIHFATAGSLPRGAAWSVIAAPGFLFLLSWLKSGRAPGSPAQHSAG